MTLGEKQQLFSHRLADLLLMAFLMGYEVRVGEVHRPPETAKLYEQQGRGASPSIHEMKLAVDLHLFKNGVYLRKTEEYAPLGEWWEGQHKDCRWGGRFKRADGNHFSMRWGNLA